MKRLFTILVIIAAALTIAPKASAYHEEMQEFANLLNDAALGEGCAVSYDGDNIIISFPPSFFSEDDIALFSEIDDTQVLAPMMANVLSASMGADEIQIFASLLSMYDTNLLIRLYLGNSTSEILLTPSMLSGN